MSTDPHPRGVTFPDLYTPRIQRLLAARGARLDAAERLADAVLQLSDHYISKPDAETPWHKDWAQIAYACYFLPLNYARVRGVLTEGRRLGFFDGLTSFTDFGSGLGTVPLAMADTLTAGPAEGLAIERAEVAERMYAELAGETAPRLAWSRTAPKFPPGVRAGHLSAFSFSLTELQGLPAWAKQSEALMIIEPGTHQDGRRLLEIRAELQSLGFSIWAPCTHAGACPLLVDSGRDWCHDRVVFDGPDWFTRLSEHLPMRNPTLTCSYLLARRAPAPTRLAGLARLTGDARKEKGQTRQMVCRGPTREFISWQTKHGEPPTWPRGALVRLPEDVVVKGKELRLLPDQGQICLDD